MEFNKSLFSILFLETIDFILLVSSFAFRSNCFHLIFKFSFTVIILNKLKRESENESCCDETRHSRAHLLLSTIKSSVIITGVQRGTNVIVVLYQRPTESPTPVSDLFEVRCKCFLLKKFQHFLFFIKKNCIVLNASSLSSKQQSTSINRNKTINQNSR